MKILTEHPTSSASAKHSIHLSSEAKLIRRVLHACLREKFLTYKMIDTILIADLPNTQKKIICKNTQQISLGKLKFLDDIIVLHDNNATNLTNLTQLLSILYEEIQKNIDDAAWKQFCTELENCLSHEKLIEPIVLNNCTTIKSDMLKKLFVTCSKSLSEYIRTQYTTSEQLIFFEAFATGGHPYHPCHKTKLGFTHDDYLKYSPEINSTVALPLAIIHKNLVTLTGTKNIDEYQNWFAQQYPEQWEKLTHELQIKNLSLTGYCPFFIHPWQYENTISKLFENHIKLAELQFFPKITIDTKPSLSFRTLIPITEKPTPHIKLPVAVYSTSAMRTVTPSSVHNGPNFCRTLEKILQHENHFDQTLKVSSEICGLYIHSYSTQIAKNLGVIYRDNTASLIKNNELPIVVAALFEKSPLSETPVFIEMIHETLGTTLQHAITYFSQYSACVLRSYFDLFLLYGCALEGHQQNTIAVFENSLPKYMINRDSGGIRVHLPTLNERGFSFDPHPDSSIIYEDTDDVTDAFVHTVLQYHLGEIVSLLAEYYDTPEEHFWNCVKQNLAKRFHALKHHANPERWHKEYRALLTDDWHVKCLMRMRLKNDAYNYESVTVRNPLRDLQTDV